MCVYIVFICSKETKETAIKEKERKERVRERGREIESMVCVRVLAYF